MLRRHEQINMTKDASSRFVKHELPQSIILFDLGPLLPNGIPRWGYDAPHDHIAHFTFGMTTDDVNDFIGLHICRPVIGASAQPVKRGSL